MGGRSYVMMHLSHDAVKNDILFRRHGLDAHSFRVLTCDQPPAKKARLDSNENMSAMKVVGCLLSSGQRRCAGERARRRPPSYLLQGPRLSTFPHLPRETRCLSKLGLK